MTSGGGNARKEKTISRTDDEHIHADAQIFPTTAAICATDRFLPRDGNSASKRARGLWKSAFPNCLQRRGPGRIRPCACNAARLLVSSRGQDVHGRRPERSRLRHGV